MSDSTFRIITWQLYVDKDTYHQYGAIQMNNSDLKLFRLLDRPSNPSTIENTSLNSEQWLGAVYYNLYEFETLQGPQYLLFGFDGNSFFTKRKILDVLKFENGKPVFGSPVFVKNIEGSLDKSIIFKNIDSNIDDKIFEYTEGSVFKNILMALLIYYYH